MIKIKDTARLVTLCIFMFASFSLMFVFREVGRFDFWWWMSTNLLVFIGFSALLFPGILHEFIMDFKSQTGRKMLYGLVSAIILYLIFLTGNYFSNVLFDNARGDIASIYNLKGNASTERIFLLMLLVIGPGEEILWRGIIQNKLMKRTNQFTGFIIATIIYTAIHVFSGNFMLVMAAMVAGIFWGWMYMKYHSVAINIISHLIWDITIFLILPIT